MVAHFYQYRYQAFKAELKELVNQLNQFILMITTLFYIFLPGLIASLFFGLGKIVQSDSVLVSIQVAFAYLLLQTLLVTVLKPAILDSRHRCFQISISPRTRHQYLADIVLLLASHALLIITMILAVAMGPQKLSQAPQLLLFILTQISFAVGLLYRPQSVILALFIAFISLWWSSSIIQFLVCINVLLIGCWFAPKIHLPNLTYSINIWSFWFYYVVSHSWAFIWRATATFLVLWAAIIIQTMRPDLLHWYLLAAVLINQLWWSTLMIETNQQLQETRLFWESLGKYKEVFRVQAILLSIVCIALWCGSGLLLDFDIYMSSALLCMPILMYCAVKKPKLIAVAWASSSITLFVLKVIT
ncbi:hypothetical protein PCIT_a1236 [Pseudoalteromonas citrea]|uniref:Uncharacterized protein n=2 Tax=Pseudoalteromonas citrea TaxID=43655 RepID=A0AAD4FTK2_9GAMM|nr:DUF6136 family protein [Pseudoalteromonas citrea]KAF7775123.1 hypothetical protein PCIT_a1236 [Pseudoalteromonas citrea]